MEIVWGGLSGAITWSGASAEEDLVAENDDLMKQNGSPHPSQEEDPLLESLRNDVAEVGEQLREIAQQVINENISDYPVFVAAQHWVDIGRPIFDREEVQLNWYFFASLLEEFVKKKIVLPENVAPFKKAFGDPAEKACIFMVNDEGARFVFVPYVIEGE